MLVERVNKNNGEIVGYFLSMNPINGNLAGKYLTIEQYNEINVIQPVIEESEVIETAPSEYKEIKKRGRSRA